MNRPTNLPWKKKSEGISITKKISDHPVYLHSTLIKVLTDKSGVEKTDFCPRQIYHYFIARDYKRVRTEYMMWGTYGEQIILGHSAYDDDDEPVIPEKNKITGAPRISEKRIIEQARRIESNVFPKMGVSCVKHVNTQIKVYKQFNEKYIVRVIYDIFPTGILYKNPETEETEFHVTILDLKFTGDINNTFGDFCWGSPEFMDHCQADLYLWAIEDIDFQLNNKLNPGNILEDLCNEVVLSSIRENRIKFHYCVVGYVKEPLDQQILFKERLRQEIPGNNLRRKELLERVRKTIAILEYIKEKEYPANPSFDICKACTVNIKNGGYCKAQQDIEKI